MALKQAAAGDEEMARYVLEIGQLARAAAGVLAAASSNQKNKALLYIAESLQTNRDTILHQNSMDIDNARKNRLDDALVDRLLLTEKRFAAMVEGLAQVVALADPVGEISEMVYRPTGIQVGKMRVPLGVIAIIYESRPNVTIDAAALCLKSANATILRGGSEAIHSNRAIAECVREGLLRADLPAECVQLVNTVDRQAVGALIRLDQYIDVIVPRGGRGLIERISREATIPVIKHLDGICHVYIDDEANLDKARAIALNAKTQRYGTCCTMETLLVAESVSSAFLPMIFRDYKEAGVEIRGCERSRKIDADIETASESDWSTEYLGPIVSVRVVPDLAAAIAHIQQYGSAHTDAIVTENLGHSQAFLRQVDSSSVMVNASTRFADGFEYGLGAEIGISTDKLHVRGPVGLVGLTTQKFIIMGDGHIRQ